jgi:ABC-type transporter MlaC component
MKTTTEKLLSLKGTAPTMSKKTEPSPAELLDQAKVELQRLTEQVERIDQGIVKAEAELLAITDEKALVAKDDEIRHYQSIRDMYQRQALAARAAVEQAEQRIAEVTRERAARQADPAVARQLMATKVGTIVECVKALHAALADLRSVADKQREDAKAGNVSALPSKQAQAMLSIALYMQDVRGLALNAPTTIEACKGIALDLANVDSWTATTYMKELGLSVEQVIAACLDGTFAGLVRNAAKAKDEAKAKHDAERANVERRYSEALTRYERTRSADAMSELDAAELAMLEATVGPAGAKTEHATRSAQRVRECSATRAVGT